MLQLADNVVSDGGAGLEPLGLRDLLPLDEQLGAASLDPAEPIQQPCPSGSP